MKVFTRVFLSLSPYYYCSFTPFAVAIAETAIVESRYGIPGLCTIISNNLTNFTHLRETADAEKKPVPAAAEEKKKKGPANSSRGRQGGQTRPAKQEVNQEINWGEHPLIQATTHVFHVLYLLSRRSLDCLSLFILSLSLSVC